MKETTTTGRVRRWSGAIICSLPLALLLAGCCVLTDAQVNAVSHFAQATKGFSTAPVAVMEAHAMLRDERGIFTAATMTTSEGALAALTNGMLQADRLRQKAAEATAALSILDAYSDLLNTLASEKFTDDLQNQSVALGTAIDQNVAAFNKVKGTGDSVQPFGDLVAGMVRGGGGILIRHMQQKALYQAVTNAEGAVVQATRSVEALMADYLPPLDPQNPTDNLITQESEEIKKKFSKMHLAVNTGGDLQTLDRIHRVLRSSERGLALARSCAAAAAAYREAHTKLVQALKSGQDPTSLIEEIKALAQQVKAAKEVRDELKKKDA